MSALEQSNPGNDDKDADNLYQMIHRLNVHGLNLTVPEDAKAIIKPWDERQDTTKYAQSNVDDQVVIHIPFAESVHLRRITLKLGRGESAPRQLRIYVNHSEIVDFEAVEYARPKLDIPLLGLEDEAGLIKVTFQSPAFSNVNTLSVFFSDSIDEAALLYYIGFKGEVRSSKKETRSKLEIPAANAADAALAERLREKTGGQQTTAK